MRAVRLTAAVVLVAASAACAPAPDDGYDQQGRIVFADGQDTSRGRQIAALVEEWNSSRGEDEKVRFVEMPYRTDDHRAQLRARAQDLAFTDPEEYPGECYDVVALDVVWTAEFARAGHLVPLDGADFGVAHLLPQPVAAATVDGRLWAVPMRTDAGLLYYRSDFLTGPPRDWSELVELARDAERRWGLKGLVGQFDRYEGLTVNALEAIWGAGGDLSDPAAPAVRDGLRVLAEGFEDGWIPAEALDFNEEASLEYFLQGKALFLRNWPYAHRLLSDAASPVAGRFAVAPLPGPGALGGWNLGVSSCSTHRRTAMEFIRFLTGRDSQRRLFEEAGFGPTIAALYQDPILRRRYPHLETLEEAVRTSRTRPATPHYEDVTTTIRTIVNGALVAPDTVDDQAADLADQLADIPR